MNTQASRGIRSVLDVVTYVVVPILGLVFWEWDWRAIVILYWLESLTIGVTTMISVARTRDVASIAGVASTTFIYVMFWIGHGVFVLMMTGNGVLPGGGLELPEIAWVPILITWATTSIAQVVVVCVADIVPLEGVRRILASTVGRLLTLHFSIILAGFAISMFDLPAILAVVLIVVHAVVQARALLSGTGRRVNPGGPDGYPDRRSSAWAAQFDPANLPESAVSPDTAAARPPRPSGRRALRTPR